MGLFLVYEQPFWKGCAPPHASHVVLHPIASPSTPLPLHSVSPIAGALAPLTCSCSSPLCSPGQGCRLCCSWVLTHPRYPVPSFGWAGTAHPAILQVHTGSCSLIFAEPLCNLSAPLGLCRDTEVLPGCVTRHFCPNSLVSSAAWGSLCPIPA